MLPNENNNKPVNLGRFSDFIQPPKGLMKIKKPKTVRSVNVVSLIASENQSPEAYQKMLDLHNRLQRVRETVEQRNLKFVATWFAHDAISKALVEVEKELGLN